MEKFSIACIVIAAAWFYTLPSIERWRDELGVGNRGFSWRGEATAKAVDAFGRKIEVGRYILYVMSDCESCSYKSIPRQTILDRASRERVIVAFQNKIGELESAWRKPVPNIYVFEISDIRMPQEWLIRAPLAGAVQVAIQDGGLRIVATEP